MEIKILIGIPTGEIPRQNDFLDSLEVMEKPEGTLITKCHGQSPARNRNLIIEQALKYDCTHLLFVDDDMVLPPKTLMKLLSHNVDIVSGLYLMRHYPHRPVIFDIAFDDGKCHHYSLNGQSGLVEVVACGFGCLLIKTEIFPKLGQPYITIGQIETDMWCDDLFFCKEVRELGYKIYCDMNSPVGHHTNATIFPDRVNGIWKTAILTDGKTPNYIPQILD